MADRNDPLTTFLFGVKITSLGLDYTDGTAFFKSVSGLTRDTEVTDFQEGGVTTFTRKVIGTTKYPNLVLKMGFIGPPFTLWNWKDLMGKSGASGAYPNGSPAPDELNRIRVNGEIHALGPNMESICTWQWVNGYPVKWTGPEFDASKAELAIESIEIAHEGLTLVQG